MESNALALFSATAGSRVHSKGNFAVGTWLSLVEHSLGVRGVGSSNLPVPTIKVSNFSLHKCGRSPGKSRHSIRRIPFALFPEARKIIIDEGAGLL
jgi:hypothetical protein